MQTQSWELLLARDDSTSPLIGSLGVLAPDGGLLVVGELRTPMVRAARTNTDFILVNFWE